jgi:hypothetical protein
MDAGDGLPVPRCRAAAGTCAASKHYDLHVWLYRHNPAGLFSAWNPNVTCAASDVPAPPGMP